MKNYISENETVPYIFELLKLFKTDKHIEAIDLIKSKNIDPQHSENIISDYSALWLKEPYIIDFFKNIEELGGKPFSHNSILKNCIQQEKNNAVQYLIDKGALEYCKDDIVYFINMAVMNHVNKELMNILTKHIDFSIHNMQNEENPSFVNIAIKYSNKTIINNLFESKEIENYLFKPETIRILESCKEKEFQDFFISKVAKIYSLKSDDYLNDKYEKGDIECIFKKMQYDILNKHLPTNSNNKNKAKI